MVSKNASQRQFAAEAIVAILSQSVRYQGYLDRYCDHLASVLKVAVSDATPAVRTASRTAFCFFTKLWPDRSERFFCVSTFNYNPKVAC